MTKNSLIYYITIFLMGTIFGSVAMFVWREAEVRPLKIFSQCLEEKTSYFDSMPYIEIGSLRDCYDRYLTSLENRGIIKETHENTKLN